MKKLVIGLALAAAASSGAHAKNACGTELCMGGLLMGENPAECKSHIEDFFEIIKYKHGKFSASRTAKAREKFLNKCASGDTVGKSRIMAKFGRIYKFF